jgi:UDP-3-O-[3-hydroxymyristoyl] glucosamine N-acyltransferase
MACPVEQLAALVQGEIHGDGDRIISGAAPLEQAAPHDITFLGDDRLGNRLRDCQAGAVVVPRKLIASLTERPALTLIAVDDPQLAFITILRQFRKEHPQPPRGISRAAHISPGATVGANCSIAPGVFLADDVVIGDNCDLYPGVYVGPGCRIGNEVTLHPHVTLYSDVILDDRVIVHAGAVLGADGFGYRFAGGRFHKIPQLGWVHIEADVEIGAGTTIDRGAVGATVVGAGTKLDNLIMIAHNCRLGRHNAFASQVGLAGSVTTGDYVRLAGQVGIKDHVHLDTGCTIGAKGGVHCDIPAGETWIGYPATPEQFQKRQLFALKKLPELREQIKTLQAQVDALTTQMAALTDVPRRAAG